MKSSGKSKPLFCPVCRRLFFTGNLLHGKKLKEGYECVSCGWKYDPVQQKEPDSCSGINQLSLNDYTAMYHSKLREDPQFCFRNSVTSGHLCPVCGKHAFERISSHDICPQCGWEDDQLMEKEPEKWAGSSNDLCLNDYIKRYRNTLKKHPDYNFAKDGMPKDL